MEGLLDGGDSRWAAAAFVPTLIPDIAEDAYRYRCFGAADDEEADRVGEEQDYILHKRPRVARVSPKDTLIPRRITCADEIARRQLEALSWLQRGVNPGLVRAKVDGDGRLGVVPSVAVLHNLAKAYVVEGQHRAAGTIILEMATSGLGPRPNTFRVLIDALLQPLMRFNGSEGDAVGGVVAAATSILAARKARDVPALPHTTTAAEWADWCERVLESARVVLKGFTGLHSMEEVTAQLSSPPSSSTDGRAAIGSKGVRYPQAVGRALISGSVMRLVYWELSCLVLHKPLGTTPQLQTTMFNMTGVVLAALATQEGGADTDEYSQRYLGVCMRAGRFMQACSLLQATTSLSLATVADFLCMCTSHCTTHTSREEGGWSVETTRTTVTTWERILVQLGNEVIKLPSDTLLQATAICFAPLAAEEETAASAQQLALLAATVVAWSQGSASSSPAALQIAYRIGMLSCLKYGGGDGDADVVDDSVRVALDQLVGKYLPQATGMSPYGVVLCWLEANVDAIATALQSATVPQYTPCVGLHEVNLLLQDSPNPSPRRVDRIRLAVKQLCKWLPQYWRYYIQGARDHHRPTLHGAQGLIRPGSILASSSATASLPDLLSQLFVHPSFVKGMLAPLVTSAPDVSLPAQRITTLLPLLPAEAQGPILSTLNACHSYWLHSVMWRSLLRLSSASKPPTPEVCRDYDMELDGLISKYIATVDIHRPGITPEDIAAMVTVSRVEGSSASSNSFYVMVPDGPALEQLACSTASAEPPFKEQNELLVRSQHRRAPQPTATAKALIPLAPLSPGMEAFSGLMRKYSVATGAVLAIPLAILAGLSDLAVYGLVQLLKAKKVMWITVLPLGISAVVASAPSSLPTPSAVSHVVPSFASSGACWVAGMCAAGGCAKSALLTGVPSLPALIKEASLFTPTPATIGLGDILTKLGVAPK